MGTLRSTLRSAIPQHAEKLQRLDDAVRAPLGLSTRVGFVSVAGGTGCSTAAGLTASVLASRRSHNVLGVNASGSQRSLLWHAGITANATSTTAAETDRRAAQSSAAATAGLTRSPSGLLCLDLFSETQPTSDARWWDAVAPTGRFFDFIVTDWGVRDSVSIPSVVSASTIVCIVTSANRTSVQHGLDLAESIDGSHISTILAINDHNDTRKAVMREITGLLPLPAVEIPHDRAHAAPRPVPGNQLKPASNLAALELAATLVDISAQPLTAERKVDA